MNEIEKFSFENSEVRTVLNGEEVWFVAKDIADILGYNDTATMTRRLDEDESIHVKLAGMNMLSTIINESGLYSAILGSSKPNAKIFKKWVTAEVLPAIRKDGGYIATNLEMSDDEIMARALLVAQSTISRKDELIAELKRTKAQITAGREAQALGRIGGMTKTVNVLQKTIVRKDNEIADLKGEGNYQSLQENSPWLKEYVIVCKAKNAISRLIANFSFKNGYTYKFRKVPGHNGSTVEIKVYHVDMWNILKNRIKTDPTALMDFRKSKKEATVDNSDTLF